MHITRIATLSLPPLGYFHLECDERVNLFVGPNASGKSTILRVIKEVCSLEPDDDNESDSIHFDNSKGERAYVSVEASEDWPRISSDSERAIWDAAPFIYIPATRINLPPMDLFDQTIEEPENVHTEHPMKSLHDIEYDLFDGRYVELVTEDIVRVITDPGQQEQGTKALKLGYSCARDICAEVMYGDAPHPYVEVKEDESNSVERVVHHNMGVVTTDHILGEPLYAGALSSGTQGTLLWIYSLALRMVNHYCWKEGWEKKPAILLIDEIENHLHPTWQRRVIPALLKNFPGLQIFATTHSPFVVAGLKARQVHLLRRDGEGRVIVTTSAEDVVGWTADEILRTMMGVEDPTDDETAGAARELRQLRNEAPRSDPAEEEHRQKRMQELRQLVNRDLLAGGPWKKQRELFEEQFAVAMKKYQQSQDLNQETR